MYFGSTRNAIARLLKINQDSFVIIMICSKNNQNTFDSGFDGIKKTTLHYVLCCDNGNEVSEKVVTRTDIKAWCKKNFTDLANIAEEELLAGHSVATTKGHFVLEIRTSIEI